MQTSCRDSGPEVYFAMGTNCIRQPLSKLSQIILQPKSETSVRESPQRMRMQPPDSDKTDIPRSRSMDTTSYTNGCMDKVAMSAMDA